MLSLGLNQSIGKGGSSPLKLPAEFISDSTGFNWPFKPNGGVGASVTTETASGTPPITMGNVKQVDTTTNSGGLILDLGKEYDVLYVQFYLNLVAFPQPANSQFSAMMQAREDKTYTTFGGVQALTIRYQALGPDDINIYSQPASQGFVQSNAARNTWYKMGIKFDRTTTTSTIFYVNGAQRLTGRAGADVPIRYLSIVSNYLGLTWQYYGLTISETGFFEPDGL